MRIGMVLSSGFPPDIRLEKELKTLKAEHEVVLLCQRRGSQEAIEAWNGIEIHRVLSSLERWWSNWRLMVSCHSATWRRKIDVFVKDCRIEALHVHDLPLLGTVLAVARDHGIPVVADLHENYPAMLEEGTKIPVSQVRSLGKLVSRVSVSIPRWKAYEREVVPQATRVLVVIDEARERLINVGVPQEEIHVVGNFASLSEVDGIEQRKDVTARQNAFRIIYAGGFDPTRDLSTVVDSFNRLPSGDFPGLELQLVGGTGHALKQVRERTRASGAEKRITVTRWLPLEQAERLMSEADVGLVPHVKSPHTDATVPHKLFQYMARRLPVIVSNCTPLERIVTATGCGMVYESGDAASLADCISAMYHNREHVLRMGAAGQEAVLSEFNWENAGDSLLRVYREITAT